MDWLFDRRLGFAVKVLGSKDPLKSNDARRPQNHPHLRVSLGYLRAIFDYLATIEVSMYRMSSELAPYLTHPGHPEFHGQLEECRKEIVELGERARKQGLRLSFHPSQFIFLSAKEERILEASKKDLAWQATFLDWMGLGREAVVVTHVGGAYDDKRQAMERWVRHYEGLSDSVRHRLVLENDDSRFSVEDIAWIHRQTGVPLVFDYQHHMCYNPAELPVRDAVETCVYSWPKGIQPKIHFSSPQTTAKPGNEEGRLLPPDLTNHADYLNPFEFVWFLDEVEDLSFDVMIEAKAKDLALLRLREELKKRHPSIRRPAIADLPTVLDLSPNIGSLPSIQRKRQEG